MGIKQIRPPISCWHWIGRFGEQKLIRWICHCYTEPDSSCCGKYTQTRHAVSQVESGVSVWLDSPFKSDIAFLKYSVIKKNYKKTRGKKPCEQRQTNFKKVNVWPNPLRLEDGGCKCQPLQVIEGFHYWCVSQTGNNGISTYVWMYLFIVGIFCLRPVCFGYTLMYWCPFWHSSVTKTQTHWDWDMHYHYYVQANVWVFWWTCYINPPPLPHLPDRIASFLSPCLLPFPLPPLSPLLPPRCTPISEAAVMDYAVW